MTPQNKPKEKKCCSDCYVNDEMCKQYLCPCHSPALEQAGGEGGGKIYRGTPEGDMDVVAKGTLRPIGQAGGEWGKRVDSIIRLIETQNDQDEPLYADGDVRVGFKKKELMELIASELSRVAHEERERIRKEAAMLFLASAVLQQEALGIGRDAWLISKRDWNNILSILSERRARKK